jgi:hypothetical protein
MKLKQTVQSHGKKRPHGELGGELGPSPQALSVSWAWK